MEFFHFLIFCSNYCSLRPVFVLKEFSLSGTLHCGKNYTSVDKMKKDFTHVLENFLHDLQEGLQNGDPAVIGILVAVVVVILTIRKWF